MGAGNVEWNDGGDGDGYRKEAEKKDKPAVCGTIERTSNCGWWEGGTKMNNQRPEC